MLLGKRSRHPIKRTTSMTGMTVDVSTNGKAEEDGGVVMQEPPPQSQNPCLHGYDQRFLAMVSPRNLAVVAVDTTAPFLRSCCLCKRRLAPGRDIYMYRGDSAFCSLECRERQMKQDERKEKLNVAIANSNKEKEDRRHSSNTNKPSNKKDQPALAAA